MDQMIYYEAPEHEGQGEILHYGMGDMIEVFGDKKTTQLLSGNAVWHAGGLAVCMRHAAQERLQAAMETGAFFDAD